MANTVITVDSVGYLDFDLEAKKFYIIGFIENGKKIKGVAQLTRIDKVIDSPTQHYFIFHFKHNKREYLQYWEDYSWYSNCICLMPQYATKGFAVGNSRIRIDDEGKEYFPEGYNPGGHNKNG